MRRLILALLLIWPAMWSGPLTAQDLEKGVEAYNRGDYATAFQEFSLIVEKGGFSPEQTHFAQTFLGVMYRDGIGISKDYVAAAKWFQLATEQGNVPAHYNLALLYEDGTGVLQDYVEAVRLYRLAAEAGHSGAQINLGRLIGLGLGAEQDYTEALKWYRLAAEQGDAFAQFVLSAGYAVGQGVIQDDVLAHMWANLGAALGDDDALKNRDAIAERLTPEQLAAAQRLARECVARSYKGC